MKTIYTGIFILLLSACASTKKESSTTLPAVQTPAMQLAAHATAYQKDTVALTQLAAIQLQQYEANKNLYFLNQVITSYSKLLERQPYNYDAILQFYRLNLFKGIATKNYDMAHWQEFYQQQPFLRSIDIAPPVYMELLLAPQDSLSNKDRINILQKTVKANPKFVNGYLGLTAMYAERDKKQLSYFLLETAAKYSPENSDILGTLNEFRVENIYDQLCHNEATSNLNKAFEDYKFLTKNQPDNAYYHMQLSTVLRLMGRMRMSSFSAKKAASISAEFQGRYAEAQFWTGNSNTLTEYFSTKEIAKLDINDLYLNIFFNLARLNWQQAADVMDEYITRNDITFYGVIYGAHAYKMLGQEAKAQQSISQGLRKITLKPWQRHMLDFANQKITSQELMAASENKCQQTEAHFIAGLSEIQAGKMAGFEKAMAEVIKNKIYSFYEYAGAKAMMKQLD